MLLPKGLYCAGADVGSFTESFQLHDFPFDTQFVTLSIASNLYKPSWKFPLGRHTCTFEIDESNYTRHWVSDKSGTIILSL